MPAGAAVAAVDRGAKREWAGDCYCDYGFHLMLHGKLSPALLGALPEAIQAGHATVKMFTTDIRPNRQGRMVQFGDIWEVLKVLGARPAASPRSTPKTTTSSCTCTRS